MSSQFSVSNPPDAQGIENGSSAVDSVSWIKEAAKEEIESLKFMRAVAWEQHSHSFKWLVGSLLALNGGGLLAIVQATGIALIERLFGGAAFALGIACALLVAVFAQHAIMASLMPLQRQIGYWMSVVDDGVRNEQFEAELASELGKSSRLEKLGRIGGWASAACFFVGLICGGVGMVQFESEQHESVAQPEVGK
ncbi:hypothetical protein U4960_15935 [Altererythrobacter sp. H2]|uniref:hypothetical protein n=1 Tax=Altererythrobacter sp. H2 TaxID=3108391 RepID=UPI002B4BEFA7|nr:hypothetical protein [Altererythrobacter sp. H2]WRK95740.1 hypothetical protein U4960_15935 [Altererythrobacter sp. H2]